MNTAPIIIVDDDLDEQEFLQNAWKELEFSNPLIFLTGADELLDYFQQKKTVPFLIICEINLHKTDGFKLKEKLLEDKSVHYKTIPFIFFSNTATKAQIEKSYDLGSVGFFIKGHSMDEIKNTLIDIVKYWQKSVVPE